MRWRYRAHVERHRKLSRTCRSQRRHGTDEVARRMLCHVLSSAKRRLVEGLWDGETETVRCDPVTYLVRGVSRFCACTCVPCVCACLCFNCFYPLFFFHTCIHTQFSALTDDIMFT